MQPGFVVSKILPVPPVRVWRLIIDTQTWAQWGPSLRRVACEDRFLRRGSRGRLQTPVGIWLPFAVDHFQPPFYWDWRVAGIPATGHRVEPHGHGHSRLSFSGPRWAAVYALVCRLALIRIERLIGAQAEPVARARKV